MGQTLSLCWRGFRYAIAVAGRGPSCSMSRGMSSDVNRSPLTSGVACLSMGYFTLTIVTNSSPGAIRLEANLALYFDERYANISRCRFRRRLVAVSHYALTARRLTHYAVFSEAPMIISLRFMPLDSPFCCATRVIDFFAISRFAGEAANYFPSLASIVGAVSASFISCSATIDEISGGGNKKMLRSPLFIGRFSARALLLGRTPPLAHITPSPPIADAPPRRDAAQRCSARRFNALF